MSFTTIAASQVDSKSPVDDTLMGEIKADLDDLDSRFTTQKTFDYEFKVNGPLGGIPLSSLKRLDGALIAAAQTFTRARVYLENPGLGGTLSVDVRKYLRPNSPITAVSRLFTANVNSVAQIAPALATQSISLATPSVNTQSVSRWKTAINVSSIIVLGAGLIRYNLASAPDSDWAVGDSITFGSCSDSANNVQTTIIRLNDDGYPCIVVQNASGVAQTSAAGSVNLDAWKYVLSNPANAHFVVGESAIFGSHTSANNDGTFEIVAVNSVVNNVVIKNSLGVAQAGVAGTTRVARWAYTYASSVATDFAVGEYGRFASHTSGVNDGDLLIKAVNSGGNNLIVYNTAGAAQGGVAGTANTTRWIIALASDPSTDFSVAQTCVVDSTTSTGNQGTFSVKQVNRLSTNNIVVSNVSGVAQLGAVGTLSHTRILFSFSSDQSAYYVANVSRIQTVGTVSDDNRGSFEVLEVNHGGGSNYNVVVDNPSGDVQASPAGRIIFESRSIFTVAPTLVIPSNVLNSTNRHMQYDFAATFNAYATVLAGSVLALDITSVPAGNPANVVVQLV